VCSSDLDQLNRESIEKAIELLNGASRIEFHASGHYGVVAQDAQFKFLRFGIGCNACTDPRLQVLAAGVLGPRDVVVAISSSGKVPELLEVVDIAHARGAAVVAITASQSPLARKADAVLIVDHDEDVATQVPMVSRILHLLVIDILAVGVAMRRQAPAEDGTLPAVPSPASRRRVAPGVSASTPLARLTSHSR
jgi:glucokinase